MSEFGDFSEAKLALIGDVRASREHADRAALQDRLRDTLEAANAARAPAVPLAITAGDEFQGLLTADQAALAVDLVVDVTEALHPVEVAFGLGWGPLATELAPERAVSELDGPCFHRARDALALAKKDSSWTRLEGAGPVLDAVVSGTFGLMAALRAGWTEKQAAYVRDARRAERFKDVAALHDVVPSVVTESLQAARFRALVRAEDGLRKVFDDFGRRPESEPDSP